MVTARSGGSPIKKGALHPADSTQRYSALPSPSLAASTRSARLAGIEPDGRIPMVAFDAADPDAALLKIEKILTTFYYHRESQ
jgi:hypothetical protein